MEDKNEESEEVRPELERPKLSVEQEVINFFAHQFTGKPEDWQVSQKSLFNEIIKAFEVTVKLKVLEGRLAETSEMATRFRYDRLITELFESLIELRRLEIDEAKAQIIKNFKIEEVKFFKFE